MAKTNTLPLTQTIVGGIKTIVNADAALTLKTLLTAGAEGAIVKAIQAVSDDSSARVLDVVMNDGTTDFLICSVNVAALSGTNGSAFAVDLLSASFHPGMPLDALAKRVLMVPANWIVKVRSQTQVTSGKTVTVSLFGESFS